MADSARARRLQRELVLLQNDPPFGVCCWPDETRNDTFHARMNTTGRLHDQTSAH